MGESRNKNERRTEEGPFDDVSRANPTRSAGALPVAGLMSDRSLPGHVRAQKDLHRCARHSRRLVFAAIVDMDDKIR